MSDLQVPAKAGWRGRLRGISLESAFFVISPLMLLLAWELLSRTGVIDARFFSAPTKIVARMWQMILDGSLLKDTWITLWRLVLGSLLGIIPGLVIGVIMGLYRVPRAIINPLIAATYPLPRVALFPLILIVFGLTEQSIIIQVALGPFFTMVIATTAAVMNIEPIYLRVAKSYRTPTLLLYTKVVLPAAMPIIFSALKISLGLGMLGVVAAEFLMASSGLGYMIWNSWQILSLERSMVGLVTSGILGFILLRLLDAAEHWAIPWNEERQN
ncbi:MAG: ABC transporter permease [Devosia sp.]|nr:ABC transporter permease [Devosia sp.]